MNSTARVIALCHRDVTQFLLVCSLLPSLWQMTTIELTISLHVQQQNLRKTPWHAQLQKGKCIITQLRLYFCNQTTPLLHNSK